MGGVHGHMGVSKVCVGGNCMSGSISPSREQPVVGDAYRYPNGGHCHGVLPQAATTTFAVGDTVKLTMSSGAAHNGGHCALFLARKSDSEEKWYKQMDFIDCTTAGEMDWTIQAALVPADCGTAGCGLIWVWTPTSSGGCEIYMNCFDIKISGNNGGADPPQALSITKNPACQRVDAQKKTASYGTFCGKSEDCVQGGATAAPTAAAAPTAVGAPSAAPQGNKDCPNCRCGTSWTNANNDCNKPTCNIENESINCGAKMKCYADMVNICVNSPTAVPVKESKCRAVGVWAADKSIHAWCDANCPMTCPTSHCICDGKGGFVEESATKYNPQCQIYTTPNAEMSIINITGDYDLAAYKTIKNPGQAGIDAATLIAAEELLTFNRNCKAVDVSDIYELLPKGDNVYITGDCQLTSDCLQPQRSAAHQKCTSLLSLFIAAFTCLAFAL